MLIWAKFSQIQILHKILGQLFCFSCRRLNILIFPVNILGLDLTVQLKMSSSGVPNYLSTEFLDDVGLEKDAVVNLKKAFDLFDHDKKGAISTATTGTILR